MLDFMQYKHEVFQTGLVWTRDYRLVELRFPQLREY